MSLVFPTYFLIVNKVFISITFNIFRFFYYYTLKLNIFSIFLIYYIINIVYNIFFIINTNYYAIITFTFFLNLFYLAILF